MMKLIFLFCFLVGIFAEAEPDPACNNCGQRPPYIKGARVSFIGLKLSVDRHVEKKRGKGEREILFF